MAIHAGSDCQRSGVQLWGWAAVVGLTLVWQSAVQAQAVPAGKLPPPAQANAAEDPPAVLWRDFEFQVLTAKGEVVAGAQVTPWQVAYRLGSMGLGPKLSAIRTTDENGRFRFSIPEDDPLATGLKEAGGFVRSVAFSIDHPNHPLWSDYVPVEAERPLQIVDPVGGVINATAKVVEAFKIVLPDGATVKARVLPSADQPALGDLYPSPPTLDWSADGDLVTLRRVDLTSKRALRWLRIVSVPATGPALFTNLVDLKQHGDPISLELPLKAGTRVSGRLADNVPRPVQNGRVITNIVVGDQAGGSGWWWGAAAPIAADGTFVFPSLPTDSNLQLLARCDGWLSAPPSKEEVEAYGTAHGFATGPRDDVQMRANERAYPQIYRLAGPALDFEVAMEPTLTCEVKVVDEKDEPLAGVEVAFWPNQYWFEAGSQLLGAELDSLVSLRTDRERGGRPARRPENADFSKKTGASGLAVIANLPTYGPLGPGAPRRYRFYVSHDAYELAPDTPQVGEPPFRSLSVTIEPGKTAQATVRMRRK